MHVKNLLLEQSFASRDLVPLPARCGRTVLVTERPQHLDALPGCYDTRQPAEPGRLR